MLFSDAEKAAAPRLATSSMRRSMLASFRIPDEAASKQIDSSGWQAHDVAALMMSGLQDVRRPRKEGP